MPYDLSTLSDEEKNSLLTQLLSRYENDVSVPGQESHGDESEDLAMLEPVLKVLDIVVSKLEELEERLEANEKLVVDDLFGGIDKMYKDNLRTKSIGDLQGKYGDMFAPHMDALKELAPDEDIYETLHDMLDPLRQEEGWDDDKEMSAVKSAADAIAQKIAKVKGTPPEGGAVEVTKVSAEPIATSPEGNFLDKVRKMKEKATAKGL